MPLTWTRQGPRPSTGGQVEGIADKEVVGAVKAVAPHPTDPDVLYVGSVNGGVWATSDARSARPSWNHLTDGQRSLSIGALEFDPTDATHQTLAAGSGRFSSMSRAGGALIGVLHTTDGGASWNVLGSAQLGVFHLCDVAPRGQTIVVAANNGGILRTTDGGLNWLPVSGAAGTGLPSGVSFALAGDPVQPTHLFAHVGAAGIFKSTDTGNTWAKVSSAAMDALLGQAVNVKISVGTTDNVYVAIAANAIELAGLFRSGNGGTTWTALDRPATMEAGPAGPVRVGLHPGTQARIHLSLAADLSQHQVLYIGGDRQPSIDEFLPTSLVSWPNSIGAGDYSGRLFRVDAARPAGSQATPITHVNTASNTAPHADSRDMAIDAQGDLIESDDGGVYRRPDPGLNTADWASMNGDLQTTELHTVAWDANVGTAIGGAQDTGSPQQLRPNDARWPSVSVADGDIAVVDDISAPGVSVRYSSWQELGGLRREVYNAAGVLQSRVTVPKSPLGGAAKVKGQFYTPFEVNQVVGARLVIGAANGVYESDDQGDTVTAIAPFVVATGGTGSIAYGAQGNPDVLYVGSGTRVLVRTAAHPAPLTASVAYPGTNVVLGVAVPPADPNTAYVIDAGAVFRTTDAGGHWVNVTGNLLTLGGVVLRSVAFCADLNGGSVIVGTNAGAFATAAMSSVWSGIGAGIPTVPIMRLRYSSNSRVLLAGTLGRGAWTMDIP